MEISFKVTFFGDYLDNSIGFGVFENIKSFAASVIQKLSPMRFFVEQKMQDTMQRKFVLQERESTSVRDVLFT